MGKRRSKSIEKVQEALLEAGLDIEVMELDVTARTAALAAAAVNTPIGSIVKSLILMADDVPILALVAGDKRADAHKIAAAVEATTARMASGEEVRQSTGYAIGGVSPVGHATRITTLMDESLWRFDMLYAAAGAPQAVFPIKTEDLARITDAKRCDITE